MKITGKFFNQPLHAMSLNIGKGSIIIETPSTDYSIKHKEDFEIINEKLTLQLTADDSLNLDDILNDYEVEHTTHRKIKYMVKTDYSTYVNEGVIHLEDNIMYCHFNFLDTRDVIEINTDKLPKVFTEKPTLIQIDLTTEQAIIYSSAIKTGHLPYKGFY